jgi:2'-5' RNA ligase
MDDIKVIQIRPPPSLRKEITATINEFANKYKVYRDANSKNPHITLLDLSNTHYACDYLLHKIGRMAGDFRPFKVRIDGIASFDSLNKRVGSIRKSHNYVIYLRVIDDGSTLSLRRKLITSFGEGKSHYSKFVPHITISHKDLDKRGFERALREYKGFRFRHSFTVKGLYLYAYSGGSKSYVRYIKFGLCKSSKYR